MTTVPTHHAHTHCTHRMHAKYDTRRRRPATLRDGGAPLLSTRWRRREMQRPPPNPKAVMGFGYAGDRPPECFCLRQGGKSRSESRIHRRQWDSGRKSRFRADRVGVSPRGVSVGMETLRFGDRRPQVPKQSLKDTLCKNPHGESTPESISCEQYCAEQVPLELQQPYNDYVSLQNGRNSGAWAGASATAAHRFEGPLEPRGGQEATVAATAVVRREVGRTIVATVVVTVSNLP